MSFFLIVSLLFTACGEAPMKPEEPLRSGLGATAIIIGPTPEGHVYAAYGAGADRFPPPRLLFFASDDAFSVATDALIRTLYTGTGVIASTFRLEFKESQGARLTYKVLVPDSIVVVTASGSEPALIHPTSDQIRSLILGP